MSIYKRLHYICSKGMLFSLIFFLGACQSSDQVGIRDQVIDSFAKEKGIYALAYLDLQSGEEILINEKDVFHAASTMKTPVMIEVYQQAAEGRFSMNDSILVKNEFYSIVDSSTYQLNVEDDSETELYDRLGTKRSIKDLVYDMIIVSSNLATNLIIELVDAKKVTQRMRDLGAADIQVLRGVEDGKAYEQGLSNRTTAYDLMKILQALAEKKAVNPDADQAMINTLLDQKFNEIIPALLPKEVKVAHKTGVITGLHHDSGIVYLPNGNKYVLVILSRDMEDFDGGTQMMAGVSKIIYDYHTSKANIK